MNLPTALPLSLALAGVRTAEDAARGSAEGLKAWAAKAGKLGFGAVQLDATAPGLRPRELGRSARRDIAALLRREGVECSGVDLWIPPSHFARTEQADRAVSAVLEALELAAEIGKLCSAKVFSISIELPAVMPADVLGTIESAAERSGVRVADHCFPAAPERGGVGGGGGAGHAMIGVGVDPATVLAAGKDPALAASQAGARLACARLSDWSATTGVGRVPVGGGGGAGSLDMLAYRVAVEAAGYAGCVVMDVRHTGWKETDLASAVHAWNGAVGPF